MCFDQVLPTWAVFLPPSLHLRHTMLCVGLEGPAFSSLRQARLRASVSTDLHRDLKGSLCQARPAYLCGVGKEGDLDVAQPALSAGCPDPG